MQIEFIDIQNYRKLKSTRIYLAENETIFVGANNSGKTSAIDALIIFLGQASQHQKNDENTGRRKLCTTDFTLSNWSTLNKFGASWNFSPEEIIGDSLTEWQEFCPSLDIWLNVKVEEIHYVSHLIPTLKWKGGLLGVRLIYQPKSLENLMSDFLAALNSAKNAVEGSNEGKEKSIKIQLWPRNIREFLDTKLSSYFEIKAYLLDPDIARDNHKPQALRPELQPLKSYPFKDMFKVDIIDAQRGFSDPYSMTGATSVSLSSQLHQYYVRHLNPTDHPEQEDVEALTAIDKAQKSFDEKLNDAFDGALNELRGLGYPGFNDPEIILSSNADPVQNLAHNTTVIFDVKKPNKNKSKELALPESYNGLGYKNLIFMIFKLISFRDRWMRTGKAKNKPAASDSPIEPLHIVLIEEPEAHLHAQVQQVFIRKAFEVLRKDVPARLSTQVLVSSHSSYIANEVGFDKLRYFKRIASTSMSEVACAEVIGLSDIFKEDKKGGDDLEDTKKFVTRYIKTTHCDLFFANGIIIVEGAAERMLLPHFIRNNYDTPEGLNRSYISILEIGGAHAQRVKPLIDALGLPTLVITDLDSKGEKSVIKNQEETIGIGSVKPKKGVNQCSDNSTLDKWFDLNISSLDEVLRAKPDKKVKANARVAYQNEIDVEFKEDQIEQAIPYTFEDALVLTNIALVKKLVKPIAMLKKMKAACEEKTLEEATQAMFDALDNKYKAKMALDVIFDIEPKDLQIPIYIKEGLDWLQVELKKASVDYLLTQEEDKVDTDE